jgi:FAD:protein FMN transferase
MRSCWRRPVIERARPLLGTYVAIRVGGLPEGPAHRAIDAAYEAIARVHRRMSFHDPASDVARLNQDAARRAVAVHRDTVAVLRRSLEVAAASEGAFDITVASELVRWGLLPALTGVPANPSGTWRDIELDEDRSTVRFHRPVVIDLGGIAKGYAVDRAVESLAKAGAQRCCVNAGGDLRVAGPEAERIGLRLPRNDARLVPVLDVENASVASSAGGYGRGRDGVGLRGPHVHPAGRCAVGRGTFACVVAERCVIADALTKIVLVQGPDSHAVLRRYQATAHVHTVGRGWRHFGEGR